MISSVPVWIQSLRPVGEPILAPFSPGASPDVWHVRIELRAWDPPPGAILHGADNWNGKALVVGADSGLDRSVAEVEIAARLRATGTAAGWTGKPRTPWSDWALDTAARSTWISTVDAQVRRGTTLLTGNGKGIPDVLQWRVGASDFCCIEYKGPSPSKPVRPDTVKPEQVAWVTAAIERGLLTADRIAVVTWLPDSASAAALIRQAAASRRGREARRN